MDRVEPALRAAMVHYALLALKPLCRACAVVARLAEAMVLQAAGYPLVAAVCGEYYLEHRGEYAARAPALSGRPGPPALERGAGDDPTPFVELCLRGLVWGLREAEGRIVEDLRRLALEQYFEELRLSRRLTARQYALLRLLLEGGHGPVGIRTLCRAAPFFVLYGRASEQTARRDLKRLSCLGLLSGHKEGFVLNRRALCGPAGEKAGEAAWA
jgi:hypothetical protein